LIDPSCAGSSWTKTEYAILIVDDDRGVARALQRVVESAGHTVAVATDRETCLQLVQSGPVGLVLMGLEGNAGHNLLAELAAGSARPDILVHTSNLDSPPALWAQENGIRELFEKPAPPQVLLDWIGRLERRRKGEPESTSMARAEVGLERLLGTAPAMAAIRSQVQRVAEFPRMSVLVCGETGTGKELVANAIHDLTCPTEPFISVNCSAIPEALFESEIFGHAAGAFTNARAARIGLLEAAGSGTIFLDEIGELPLSMQPKLLRVLETRMFRPVGANKERELSARVISATNKSLTEAKDTFRPDLYYRLAGFAIGTPALRDHPSDIGPLATNFLRRFCRDHGHPSLRLTGDAKSLLETHFWPGNIRELRGVIENAAVSTSGSSLSAEDLIGALGARGFVRKGPDQVVVQANRNNLVPQQLPPSTQRAHAPPLAPTEDFFEAPPPPSSGTSLVGTHGEFKSLPTLEKHVITDIIIDCEGNLSLAARTLGIPRSTLRDRLKRYGIALPEKSKRLSERD